MMSVLTDVHWIELGTSGFLKKSLLNFSCAIFFFFFLEVNYFELNLCLYGLNTI